MSVTNLPRLINRLSTVPGWAVIPTIQKQSVAEHTLNVIAIVDELTKNWTYASRMRALEWALRHDADEAIHGDFPTTSKNKETVVPVDAVMAVVKLADLAERVSFLLNEMAMGNQSVLAVRRKSEHKLREYVRLCEKKDWYKTIPNVYHIITSMDVAIHPSMEDNDVS